MQKGLDPALAKAVNQYLNRTGLTALADAFQDECESRNISLKKVEKISKIPESNDLKKRLLQSIEKNDKSRFFRLFSEAFPNITESIASLEFQFQVYFATSPLRKTPPDRNEYRERVQELKTYLEEGNGARMAKNTELLPYFALPYVSDPMKHPVFKELLSACFL
uniref:LisH domain-containing protein n=1 Tax=Panagrolaimus sp. PS1159 TaxID=55785 RepID=A0AC35FM99_9BILA